MGEKQKKVVFRFVLVSLTRFQKLCKGFLMFAEMIPVFQDYFAFKKAKD